MRASNRTGCPIITLCKISNAIVFTPKKYPTAQMPTLIFFGVQKPYFFPNRTHPICHSTPPPISAVQRSEEHTSELQSRPHLVCRLLLEKKKNNKNIESHESLTRDTA